MAIAMFTDPKTQIDIQVRPAWLAEVVSQFRIIPEEGCVTYKSERQIDAKGGGWYVLEDISGKAWAIPQLIQALERMSSNIGKDAIYILIHRRKGQKHVQKLGKENGAGSEGGNSGEANPDI